MTASEVAGPVVYLDASAVVKLVVAEAESHALADHLQTRDADALVTSALSRVEVSRAVRRRVGSSEDAQLDAVLAAIGTISIDAEVVRLADALGPHELRSLDAIHVATALTIGAPTEFVTYDTRCADAARSNELPVIAPA